MASYLVPLFTSYVKVLKRKSFVRLSGESERIKGGIYGPETSEVEVIHPEPYARVI